MNIKLFVRTLIIVCLFLNTIIASPFYSEQKVDTIALEYGGIRTIVQGFSSIEIHQDKSASFLIKIYDDGDNLVYLEETENYITNVSTENWTTGAYLIITIAEGEAFSQDFRVSIP